MTPNHKTPQGEVCERFDEFNMSGHGIDYSPHVKGFVLPDYSGWIWDGIKYCPFCGAELPKEGE